MPPQQTGHRKHISHLVLGLPMGGTEGLVDQMLRHPPEGFVASAICLDEIGVLGESAIKDGFEVRLISRGSGISLKVPWLIARHARYRSIDILHCHHYTPWFYGSLARFFLPRLKVIFTEHGRLYPDPPSNKKRIFNRCMFPITDCITAVSPAVAQALHQVEGFPPDQIRVVFNGVDGRRFVNLPKKQDLRVRFSLRQDFVYFVLCSRFDPIKWIDGLLQALRRVIDAQPHTGLLLVGDGQECSKIKQRIIELGLQAHVVMPGYRKDIPEWLAASDIFVLSSLSEGTSVSLIESMAVGIPAVVTRVGGNEYVVENGITGLLVAPQDIASLAAGMHRLASDSVLREMVGNAAEKRFREQFEISRMFEAYEDIYHRLIH
jgi:L-malate glycosyltransferase